MRIKVDKTSEIITLFICVTIILATLILTIGWVNSPSFRIEMDNNTLQAIKSLNDTVSNINAIPEYSIYNDSNCHFITENQKWWCTVQGWDKS